ncbi:MAG TPA: YtxH domain-containing protein [Candidatus Limnocylindria bacterium]|jgi:gas vesicle protein|nr:YtxH domain-containing protein [Candidatus Limnocylindria bacterium]
MASGTAGTADDLSAGVKSIVDRVLEADVTETIAQRGKEIAAVLSDATETAAERAQQAWRESAPARRDAQRGLASASKDATAWGSRTWKDLRPQLRDLWKRRSVAIGAASAAVPAGRGLVDVAAQRLSRRQRERRHWGAFFLGMLIGAAAGAAIALLTAPKPGSAMRDEIAEKARGAAENAPEWVPLFQRDAPNGSAAAAGLDQATGVDQAAAAAPSPDADVPPAPREGDEGS